MIKDGQVVELSYVLKDKAGKELDRADKGEPLTYLHGHGQIIPGLEEALLGLNVGDKKSVVIEPENGYGNVNPDLRIKIERSHFPKGQKIEVGMQFVAEMGNGHVPFTVKKVESNDIFVDGNHPLAGETLYFDVEVVGMREATKEELEHGHAHGPGGHHH
jgi:FKBP-type peptidyl-prolyl cis-trans isomerase SlyD